MRKKRFLQVSCGKGFLQIRYRKDLKNMIYALKYAFEQVEQKFLFCTYFTRTFTKHRYIINNRISIMAQQTEK